MDSDEENEPRNELRRPQRVQVVPTLKEITINVLGRFRHCLGESQPRPTVACILMPASCWKFWHAAGWGLLHMIR